MGLVMEHGGTIEGYEAVPLALPADMGPLGSGAAVPGRCPGRYCTVTVIVGYPVAPFGSGGA
jgi:hypothetical protein